MDNSYNSRSDNSEVFSTKIRAGKRTYFFDVKETRSSDYYITITESKRRFSGDGYDKHKIFLYKEDFNKFMDSLNETINHVKTNLMPDYNYDEFARDSDFEEENNYDGPRTIAADTGPNYNSPGAQDNVETNWD